jgi:hypothetical protein
MASSCPSATGVREQRLDGRNQGGRSVRAAGALPLEDDVLAPHRDREHFGTGIDGKQVHALSFGKP